jgi:hypothetical protein
LADLSAVVRSAEAVWLCHVDEVVVCKIGEMRELG